MGRRIQISRKVFLKMAQTTTKSQVTLKGSAQMVAEFFNYGINSILYQRGIYPPESFTRKQEYGLTILVSTNEKVNSFLKNILSQIKDWLEERKVRKLVVVLASVETKETLERWEFDVQYDTENNKENESGNKHREKTDKMKRKSNKKFVKSFVKSLPVLPSCLFWIAFVALMS